MTHVKARAWIKRLPEGQGHPLDAGAKLLLMELWDRVDWSRESDSPARDCYPSRRRLAEDTGTTLDTIKSRLVRLASAGWIRREGDGWALAWARPWPVDPGDTSPDPGHRSPGSQVTPGDADPDPRVIQTPAKGDNSPDPGSQITRIPSQDQVQNQPHDRDRSASTPEPDPLDAVFAERGDLLTECPDCDRETEHVTLGADRVQCSVCGRVGEREHRPENPPSDAVETGPSDGLQPSENGPTAEARKDGPGHAGDLNSQPAAHPNPPTAAAPIEPEPPPSSPPPARPRRKRKAAPPRAGQAALELGAEPDARDVVAELLELHGRLRAEAQRHHGERVTALPSPKTRVGSSMRAGCRQALRDRGEAWCREMLEWQGARWKANASQLAWSGHNVWTSTSCDNAARFMVTPARASPARRGPTLSAPPPGEIPKYQPTTDEDNEAWNL